MQLTSSYVVILLFPFLSESCLQQFNTHTQPNWGPNPTNNIPAVVCVLYATCAQLKRPPYIHHHSAADPRDTEQQSGSVSTGRHYRQSSGAISVCWSGGRWSLHRNSFHWIVSEGTGLTEWRHSTRSGCLCHLQYKSSDIKVQ